MYSSTANNGGIVGLARDGHLIVGPYNEEGNWWGCQERDICNGAFIGDDNQYVYVATTTFPYVAGCWGPGPIQEYEADCSNSNCTGSGAVTNISLSLAAIVTTVFSMSLV